jgi:two-component system LytT family sensor kinase
VRLDRRRTLAIACAVYAAGISTAFAALYLSRSYTYEGTGISYTRAVAWQAIVYFSWLGVLPMLVRVIRRNTLRPARWRGALIVHGTIMVAVVAGHAILTSSVTWLMRPIPTAGRPTAGASIPPLFVERLPIDLLMYLVIVGALLGVTQWDELRNRERAALLLEAELSRAQLHALRAQLQPHFLFNALQAIASLIRTDPESARGMVVHLGDLLRATLQHSGTPYVPLRRELELLRHYLAIEAIRFRDRLTVRYDITQDTLDCLVPDLVLQPLAENAVKHGIQSQVGGGLIEISAALCGERLVLRVRDTGVGLVPVCNTDTGLGVQNTRARVEQFDDGSGKLDLRTADDGQGVVAEITLPVVRGRSAS